MTWMLLSNIADEDGSFSMNQCIVDPRRILPVIRQYVRQECHHSAMTMEAISLLSRPGNEAVGDLRDRRHNKKGFRVARRHLSQNNAGANPDQPRVVLNGPIATLPPLLFRPQATPSQLSSQYPIGNCPGRCGRLTSRSSRTSIEGTRGLYHFDEATPSNTSSRRS